MDHKTNDRIWKDESKEDINTIKFLELLLKYDYMWCKNEEMKLNLTKRDKRLFLKECSESIERIDETRALLIIEVIKNMFKIEFLRIQKVPKNVNESIPPWFFKAFQVFQEFAISEASAITCHPTTAVDIASNMAPASVRILKNDSTSASALSSTLTVEQSKWNTMVPNSQLSSVGQEKVLVDPSLSLKNVCDNDSNVKSQRNVKIGGFPIIYPVCILPWASLGRFVKGSSISCSRNRSKFFSGNQIPVDQYSSSHRPKSDFLYLSGNERTPNPTNSYRPNGHLYQVSNQDRNFSQSAIFINPMEPSAKSFTNNNSSVEIFSSPVSFDSSTTKTPTLPVFRTKSSNSSETGIKFPSLLQGKSKVRNSSDARTKSFTLSGPGTKIQPLPQGKSEFRPCTTGIKPSTLLPTRAYPPRRVTTSICSFPTTSTPNFTNSVSNPFLPRTSISQIDRPPTLPVPTNSMSREVDLPHQMVVRTAPLSSASYERSKTIKSKCKY